MFGGNFTKWRHDGLCEYVSRSARVELVSLAVSGAGSARALARTVGVSHVAVLKWLRFRDVHPSNANLRKIVGLAAEFDDAAVSRILKKDLQIHQECFKNFIAGD
ncbi:MAG: hypothetical protein ABH852_00500 [Methanobacteriota archaeon]